MGSLYSDEAAFSWKYANDKAVAETSRWLPNEAFGAFSPDTTVALVACIAHLRQVQRMRQCTTFVV